MNEKEKRKLYPEEEKRLRTIYVEWSKAEVGELERLKKIGEWDSGLDGNQKKLKPIADSFKEKALALQAEYDKIWEEEKKKNSNTMKNGD